ncbi:hypothetical protein MMC22_004144 [Lobaria immixta]|nr:hypothetical protein [Lobaria immixta]
MAILNGSEMGLSTITTVLMTLLAGAVVRFLFLLYKQRRMMSGLPKPPHSHIFGHLITMGELVSTLPPDLHPHSFPHFLRKKYPDLGPVFYLDNWPVAYPICAVVDPDVAYQATQQNSLPKHQINKDYIEPFVGKYNMLTLEGKLWKQWRSIFNPSFASGHVIDLVPRIIEDTLIFCDTLSTHAEKSDVFSLEDVTTKLTIDVIGRVVIDTSLHAQTSQSELVSAFRNQVRWIPDINGLNPLKKYNPVRPFVYWYNTRKMNGILGKVLDDRFASRKANEQSQSSMSGKPIIDLALDNYLNDGTQRSSNTIDPTFKEFAVDQIKLFLFAGHDTTSTTACYVYHLLSKNPSALHRVRKELDHVLGLDIAQGPRTLAENPHLLNQLNYSNAVIKEALRLYPPVSSARTGKPGYFLEHDGVKYPTEGFLVLIGTHAMQRGADYWEDPLKFMPERWLAKEGDPLAPVKGTWRPFEHGPRNCIGQELALIEIKVIMALTLRSFDISSVYEELDKSPNTGNGSELTSSNSVEGDMAYQILLGTAKPVKGMPARVKRRLPTDY